MYLLKKADITNFAKVKSHTRKSKKGTFVVREFDRKDRIKKETINKIKATAIATAVGLPVLSYLAVRGRYRLNMKTTFNNAVKKAESIIVDIPNEAKSVTFAMPGFTGIPNSKITTEKIGYILQKTKPKTKVITLENKRFNVNNPLEYTDKNWSIKQLVEMPKTVFNTLIKQGRNEEAENMLSQVLAAKRQRPDIHINLFGTSAAGNVVNEVSEHLTTLGIKHKGITIGTGYYGLTKPSNTIKNFTNKLDPYTALTPKINTTYTVSGKNHNMREYLKDTKIRNEISNYFS